MVSLLRQPLTTLGLFCTYVGWESVRMWLRVVNNSRYLAYMLAVYILAYCTLDDVNAHVLTAGWWIMLGFLSSCGLGTGVHTFVLYLAPHIAQTTLTLSQQGHGLIRIYLQVAVPAMLWGVGTAVGELPPYIMAKGAVHSGSKNVVVDTLQNTRVRTFIEKWGFWAIVLMASIPNPLFDLAGITCGSLNMPLATFIGATVVGKACIKSNLQTWVVILALAGDMPWSPAVRSMLAGVNTDNDGWLAYVWGWCIVGVLVFFGLSMIQALAQVQADRQNIKTKKDA